MGHISRIYEALLNREEKICHKSRIVSIINEYKKKFSSRINTDNAVKYFSRHGYIKRIITGYYYINSIDERKRGFCNFQDKEVLFIALNKLSIKWYVGLGSALYLAGKQWQVPRILHIANNRLSGTKRIWGLQVRFFKVKESLFFGLKSSKINKTSYHYSNPDKTWLDMVYLGVIKKAGKKRRGYINQYPKWVGKR